ncbi:DUF1206 domain-containing protein [Ornithinicoccus halotolerans]|uniref:DUF1206 domain-containing protein n=1 Tax=Ornithinicoccus halotolerans TaxID=1748220 RepID=UPI001E5B02E4|nr:DUF1206 domain-containing protein [Ornithinicoccus halotolerans]
MSDAAAPAAQVAEAAGDHPVLRVVARVGFAVNGALHLLIAWLATRLALGDGGEVDQGGALEQVARAPAGEMMLWLGATGFLGLALWQATETLVQHHPDRRRRWGERSKAAAKSVTYLVLAVTTGQFAVGAGSDSGETTADLTTALMQAPLGQLLVAGVGLAVVGVAGYHVHKGATRRFLRDLDGAAPGRAGQVGRAMVRVGTVGYLAKGVALALVGGLFVVAAWTSDPQEATGLDGALRGLTGHPVGTALLLVIAAGVAGYGLYSLARARWARL